MKTKISFTLFLSLIYFSITVLNAQVKIVTGFKNGSYTEMANDIKRVAKDVIKVDTSFVKEGEFKITETEVPFVSIKTTTGSYFNGKRLIGNINKKEKEVFFIQEDVLTFIKDKSEREKGKDCTKDIRILLPLGKEEIHLIVRADSRIKSIKDLRNRTVSIGSVNQGTNITASTIKEITGINWKSVNMSFGKAKTALLSGNIDAFFFVGSAPVKDIASAGTDSRFKLVPISDKKLDKHFMKSSIFADAYKWIDADVGTYSVNVFLATNVKTEDFEDAENVRILLSTIKQNIAKLQEKGHKGWKFVKFDFSKVVNWEIHEAAMKVFDLY
ncbi:MAG: TAXI family TRAP transporter solute-binding subunit [Bacteroidetes bacterium]|jgi:TRAP transporter TAXI family solute receptor|nr:TAXI family TRAP transporter solute-binding subunit [Bacteroidota bacterium]MBT6686065.1 TAXI family TRAP transporter solute-binding subunit [Bacteroidota bacterium]MBT7144309.1 TAXI family TRAP transporter solute-binding subunit [Bacteroidota bacterium]MBT7490378.1 TAXI family TRAP transporter solute-binding subunit [Bacteroidota bacterium]